MRFTAELVAFIQDQRRERYVLEGRDITWWDERGALREDREEGSAVDQIQVLPWSNTLLIRPTRTWAYR